MVRAQSFQSAKAGEKSLAIGEVTIVNKVLTMTPKDEKKCGNKAILKINCLAVIKTSS